MTARESPEVVPRTACHAPAVQLFFRPDGEVRACCVSSLSLGNLRYDRLADVWAGQARRGLVDRLAAHDYTRGCADCGAEVALEGREVSYPAHFDRWAAGAARWPRLLDFNLSIDCNLQCIQCDGDKSSSIRIHRERRAPLPRAYDDRFFEDVLPFLAHAEQATFSGGEPFMASESYRIWDLVPRVNPALRCKVITNATVWNSRVERAIATVPMDFVFSIDGATAETYEAIRLGADFSTVVENLDRFLGVARERGTTASINHCLMPSNVHEFAEMLLFAEARGLHVDVSVVRQPAGCSIARLADDDLRAVARDLRARSAGLVGRLRINAATWEREVARISSWAAMDHDERRPLWALHLDTVAGMPRQGAGATDDTAVRRELSALPGRDRVVHSLDIDAAGRIVACSPGVHELGLDPVGSLGADANQLHHLVAPLHDIRETARDDDRIDLHAVFRDRPATIVLVALRDGRGWADVARVLVRLGDAAQK